MGYMSALFAAKAALFAGTGTAAVDAVQKPVVDDKPAITAEVPASYQESSFYVLSVQADSFDDYANSRLINSSVFFFKIYWVTMPIIKLFRKGGFRL